MLPALAGKSASAGLKLCVVLSQAGFIQFQVLSRLTSFVVGQEDPSEGCRINGIKYPPAVPAFYGKGVSSQWLFGKACLRVKGVSKA